MTEPKVVHEWGDPTDPESGVYHLDAEGNLWTDENGFDDFYRDSCSVELARLAARVAELEAEYEELVYAYSATRYPLGPYGELKAEIKRLRKAIIDKGCGCVYEKDEGGWVVTEVCWRCDTLEDLGIDPEREKL